MIKVVNVGFMFATYPGSKVFEDKERRNNCGPGAE